MGRLVRAVVLLALLAPMGCGGEGDDTASSSTASEGSSPPATTTRGSAAKPSDRQAQAWQAIGRRACRGMDPVEAARRFEAAARRAGAHQRFIALVTEPTAAVERSPGYPRLVAAFYATTRPEPQRALAAAGCAEELAAHG